MSTKTTNQLTKLKLKLVRDELEATLNMFKFRRLLSKQVGH